MKIQGAPSVDHPRRVGAADAGSARGPRRRRRTQEERSARTRARVIDAATACVAELGVGGATLSVIATRAGVSWGAMQHQFGDKDAILDAVLHEGLAQLEISLLDIADQNPDPRARVHAFVTRFGELLRGPVHRSVVEIQSARSRNRASEPDAGMLAVSQAMGRIWDRIFGDLALSRERLAEAQHFTWALLAGITAERMLFPEIEMAKSQLRILAETLLRLLELEA